MKKRVASFMAGAAVAAVLFPGCGGRPVADQIKFGVWASQNNLWDEAIFRWKKAVEENPGSVAALNNLGVAFERKGMLDEALKAYEAALKLAPKNETVKSNLGKCKELLQPVKPPEKAKTPDGKK